MMTFTDFEERLQESVNWLHKEFASIRTGQAAPALLDGIKVDSYGVKVPIVQIASVGVEDARTLRVSPWDASQIGAIETAIREADLGVSVVVDASGLRVVFPELTSERRAQLTKLAKQKLEDARISVRQARDEILKQFDTQEKNGELSEDEKYTHKERVQKMVDATNKKLESLYEAKETELSK